MPDFENEINNRFMERTGKNLEEILNESFSQIQEFIATLIEVGRECYEEGRRIEHDRGYEEGYESRGEDINALLIEQHDVGYNEAMEICEQKSEEAYKEGYRAAVQRMQDAILHVGWEY